LIQVVFGVKFKLMEVLYMTEKGQVTVPRDSRSKHGLGEGSRLLFMETKSGTMVLRPVKDKPQLTLVEHLTRFKGVELPQMKAHCPPRV
jgi:AbrB family looped-hinge helix DNA binding protein